MKRFHVLLLALLLDGLLGDPPNRWHPVAWMGQLIAWFRRLAPSEGKFLYGGLIILGGGWLVWQIAGLVQHLSQWLPRPLNWLVEAWLLKTTFALAGLNRAAQAVETAVQAEDLPEARRLLSWHLVSRDTSRLSESQICAAAIESVAENSSDGVIAPMMWYSLGGLPAALTYRYVQTSDSMLGYRDTEREWLGKIPARTDDLLNLIPARLTALAFVALHPSAWSVWRQSARLTSSPNAGHPMSGMAGALGVKLEKVGHYTLNPTGRPPRVTDIQQARRLMVVAVGVFVVMLSLLSRRLNRSHPASG